MCWPVDITGSAGSLTPLARPRFFLLACASVSTPGAVVCTFTFLFVCFPMFMYMRVEVSCVSA